jgi:hypothetical protein
MAEPSRRLPAPWHADTIPGGYVVRDANGQAPAYLYSRDNPTEAPSLLNATSRGGRSIGWLPRLIRTSRPRKRRTGRATAERAPASCAGRSSHPSLGLDSGYRGFLPFAQCEQSCSLDNGRDHRTSWIPVVGGASCSRFENPDLSAGFVAPAPHHSVSAEQDEAGWPHQGCQGHRR